MSSVAVALGGLGGCIFPMATSSFETGPAGPDPDPTIVYDLQPQSNEDYVTVYGGNDPEEFARLIAPSLPMEDPQFGTTFVDYDIEGTIVSDAAGRRLATRQRNAWRLQIDTKPLMEAARTQGIDRIRVTACYPTAEAHVSPAGTPAETYDCNLLGTHWNFTTDASPFTILVELVPRESAWTLFVGILAGWFALWSFLALFVGRIMRRDLARSGGGMVVAATLLSLPGGLIGFGSATAIGVLAGPADNLALARDLGAAEWLGAAIVPATGAFVPSVVLLVTLVWGTPWRRGRELRKGAVASDALRPPSPPPT